jgi:hypothetical protein
MGVEFDRILNDFDGPFEKIEDLATPPAGEVSGAGQAGYLLSHEMNDAFIAINRLLGSGEEVFWFKNSVQAGGNSYPIGTMYIPAKDSTQLRLERLAADIGLDFVGVESTPGGDAFQLRPVRIGLWDQYGGSQESGYLRWILEQFEFPFELVFPPTLDAGHLAERFDVLVFPNGAIGESRALATGGMRTDLPDPQDVPPAWRDRMGSVTASRTIPQLRRFLDDGGTIITIGSSTSLGNHLDLPISDHLVEPGTGRPVPSQRYFVPGSIVQARVDNSNPLAYGLPADSLDVYFNNSPVFRIRPGLGVRRVAWFDSDEPLRSGWAWGQHHLNRGVAVVEADVGAGKLFLLGFDVINRAQAHGTFKFLFNGIYYGNAESEEL